MHVHRHMSVHARSHRLLGILIDLHLHAHPHTSLDMFIYVYMQFIRTAPEKVHGASSAPVLWPATEACGLLVGGGVRSSPRAPRTRVRLGAALCGHPGVAAARGGAPSHVCAHGGAGQFSTGRVTVRGLTCGKRQGSAPAVSMGGRSRVAWEAQSQRRGSSRISEAKLCPDEPPYTRNRMRNLSGGQKPRAPPSEGAVCDQGGSE